MKKCILFFLFLSNQIFCYDVCIIVERFETLFVDYYKFGVVIEVCFLNKDIEKIYVENYPLKYIDSFYSLQEREIFIKNKINKIKKRIEEIKKKIENLKKQKEEALQYKRYEVFCF